jgi:hypothetical protein
MGALVVPLHRAGFVCGPRGGVVEVPRQDRQLGRPRGAGGLVAATGPHLGHSCTRIEVVNLSRRNTNGSWRPTKSSAA